MRTCAVCRQALPGDQYHREKRVRDGLNSICKPCLKAKRRGKHGKRPGRPRYQIPEKARARERVRDAVRYGKLIKPSHCEKCGEPVLRHLLDGHHEDYSKPLDVIWLCRSCHGLAPGPLETFTGTSA